MLETDVLVIGSEGAGARAAIAASDAGADTTIVTKGRLARSGATLTAAADFDVDSATLARLIGRNASRDDSPEAFFRDMVVEGRYLNDQPLVELHVRDAPLRAAEMLEWGLRVYDLRQMPGHSYPRNMYTSGHDMMVVLKRQVRKRPIRLVEDTVVTDLLRRDGQVTGAVGLDLRRGELVTIAAKAVVLATGGSHNTYAYTTGPEELTGDGQAIALRAGAELVNMEMVQFLPTTLMEPPIARGQLFPFLLGVQNALRVWLLNRYGERFMQKWDPLRMEHSTRDVLSIGIMTEVAEGRGSPLGGVYYSLAHLPKNLVRDFARWGAKPFIDEQWSSHGLNFRHLVDRLLEGDAIEVAPAAHFFMGGVRVDEQLRTNVPGLFAAGEVSGGLHGANRLSGNATVQVVVQGARAGEAAARFASGVGRAPEPALAEAAIERIEGPLRRGSGPTAYEVRAELQRISAEQVGVLRDGARLEQAVGRVVELRREAVPRLASRAKERVFNPEWVECLQVESLAANLEVIARSALLRTESRGAHYRRDYPEADFGSWQRNTVVAESGASESGGAMSLATSPVRVTTMPAPERGAKEDGHG